MGSPNIGPVHIRNTLIPILCLPAISLAAPIRDSSTSFSWLACLTVLLILSILCLSAFKLLFVRHRQSSSLKGPASALVGGKYTHRTLKSSRFPPQTTCKISETCKGGFLIGLFGSPSFEIRSKPSEITLIYPGADASKSSQKRDLSGDTSTTCKTKKSDFSTGPILLFSEKDSWQTRHPIRFDFSTPFRKNTKPLFLPSQLSFELGRIRGKKNQTQRSSSTQEGSLPWPHNHLEHATLRLVKVYTDSDASLPLFDGVDAVPGYPPPAPAPATPSHSLAVAYLNRSQPTSIRALPPLPPTREDQKQELVGTPMDLNSDHLYNNALFHEVKSGRRNSRRASLSPNLSIIDEACQFLPEMPHPDTIDQAPGDIGELAKPLFVRNSVRSPPLTYNAYDTFRRRERMGTRSSLSRHRRSPPLGPSPLRSMVLPDAIDDDTQEPKGVADIDLDNIRTPGQTPMRYQHLGLGLPALQPSSSAAERLNSQDPNDDSSEEQESVLDFLRELAEETRDWDESIVLDEDFRSMIQRSQAVFGRASLENVGLESSPNASSVDEIPPGFVSFWIEDSPGPT